MTGIVGVRDILGTGLGLDQCEFRHFVSDHPIMREIFQKICFTHLVLRGSTQVLGGSATGIPTVNGAIMSMTIVGKPLVYYGTGGLMPKSQTVDQRQDSRQATSYSW